MDKANIHFYNLHSICCIGLQRERVSQAYFHRENVGKIAGQQEPSVDRYEPTRAHWLVFTGTTKVTAQKIYFPHCPISGLVPCYAIPDYDNG